MKTGTQILIVVLLIFGHSQADIIEVPNDYLTIQQAIDSAVVNLDTVLVHPGTYYEHLTFNNRLPGIYDRIVLVSEYFFSGNISHIDSTILDGQENGTILGISRGPLEIIGFTFQNGKSSSEGGAIRAVGGFDGALEPLIKNCVFKNNTAKDGGVAYTTVCGMEFQNCRFYSNSASYSGGVGKAFNEGSMSFTNCEMLGNQAGSSGGVMSSGWDSGASFLNCKMSYNSAANGGALSFGSNGVGILSCSIHDNTASTAGGAIYMGDRTASLGFSETERSSIYNNRASTAKDIYCDGPPTRATTIYLDTFSVCQPTDEYVYPSGSFTYDILHPLVPCDTSENDYVPLADFDEWQLNYIPEAEHFNLTAIDFYDESNGLIAIEGNKYILKTNDGGISWERFPTNFGEYQYITSLHYFEESEGIAFTKVGFPNVFRIFKTEYGAYIGSNTIDHPPLGDEQFIFFKAFTKDRFVISKQTKSYFTADAGENWSEIPLMSQVCVVSDNLYFGFGDELLYKSVDGGSNWLEISVTDSGQVWSADFFDATTLVLAKQIPDISGFQPQLVDYLYSLTNTGNDIWNSKISYSYGYFDWEEQKRLLAFSDGTGYAMSQSNNTKLLKTTDHGNNWEKLAAPTEVTFNTLYKIPGTEKGFMVGNHGVLFCRGLNLPDDRPTKPAGEWVKLTVPEAENLDLTVVDFYDHENGFIGTSIGEVLLKTTDSGESWEQIPTNISNKRITSLRFWDDQQGVAFCQGIDTTRSYLMETYDGGYNWYNISLPEVTTFNLFRAVSTNELMLATNRKYYFTEDGGENWIASSFGFHDICIYSKTLIYGFSDYLKVSKDGGRNWDVVSGMVYNEPLRSADFFSEEKGIIARTEFHTNNEYNIDYLYQLSKGNDGEWHLENQYTYDSADWNKPKKVCMFSENTAYVISKSTGEKLLETNDGGQNWYNYELDDDSFLNDIYKTPFTDTGFIVGNNGLILKRAGTFIPQFSTASENIQLKVYPNPSQGQVTIAYYIPSNQKADLLVFNVLGQKIDHIFSGVREDNEQHVGFNFKSLANGIYFLILKTEQTMVTKKIVILH